MVNLSTTSFNIQKFYIVPTEHIYVFVCISKQSAAVSSTTSADLVL